MLLDYRTTTSDLAMLGIDTLTLKVTVLELGKSFNQGR